MILDLTLTVVGKVGPYQVETGEATRTLAERVGGQVAFRNSRGVLRVRPVVDGSVSVVEYAPGALLVKARVDVGDGVEELEGSGT